MAWRNSNTIRLYIFKILEEYRRALRQQAIPSEAKMWMVLRNRQFLGLKFRRQYSIGLFIVDFYCPKLHLAIEVDGPSHYWPGRPEHDAQRQKWLEEHGITVVRFLSSEVIENLDLPS